MKNWIGLVISDEALKNTIQTLLKVNNNVQVVGVYSEAREAVSDLKKKGDVLVIFGIGADHDSLRELKILQLSGPFPVLGVGGIIEAAPLLFDAFRLGMIDFVPLSPEDIGSPTDLLLRSFSASIQTLSSTNITRIARAGLKPFAETEKASNQEQASYYVVLGVPPGGVNGTIKLLSQLPRRRDASLIVSLPIPQVCLGPFISNLSAYTQWSVRAAGPDELIYGGTCWLFPSDDPYTVEGSIDGQCRIVSRHENVQSIDSLMEGLAGSFSDAVLGVLMEGIGRDGIEGLSAIRSRGGTTLAIKAGGGVLTEAASGATEKGVGDFLVDISDLPKALTTFMGEMNDITNINRLLGSQ